MHTLLNEGKKSLETLMRESAYNEVVSYLQEQGIEVEKLETQELEALVSARVAEKKEGLKGFAKGAGWTLLLSMFLGG